MATIEFKQLSPHFRGAKTRMINGFEKVMKISALQMEARSKNRSFSQFNNVTGRLRQSIAGRFVYIDGKPTAILQAGSQFGGKDVEHAKYIEFGTKYIRGRQFLKRSVIAQQGEIGPKLRALTRTIFVER